MKVKTSEAKDQVLNYLVAKAMGMKVYPSKSGRWMTANYGEFNHRHGAPFFCPSTDWAQGGPIIEREGITVSRTDQKSYKGQQPWVAYRIEHLFEDEYEHEYQHGPTPLIAAMRCYVASKLGDEVEIPEELK